MIRKLALAALLLATTATVATAQPWRDRDSRGRGGDMVLYEHNGFGGRRIELDGPEPDLTRYGFNDTASSLRARGRWEVCEHVNFQGRCFEVRGEEAALEGFNDRISSVRPIGGRGGGGWNDRDRGPQGPIGRGPGGSGGAVLFEHAGFGGRAIEVGAEEPDLNRYGFNDQASSIRVGRGAWRLCSDAYFQGTCVIVQTDLGNLGDLRLNDRVSSIQRIQ